MTDGVYFSANDAVFPWTRAFLQSFRSTNPTLPLYLIPFNDQYEKVIGMKQQFDFRLFDHEDLRSLESLGNRFELGYTSYGKYWFRRYAAFWGPLDRFAYFDARQLILGNIAPAFAALDRLDLDLIHFDTAINQVYEAGPHRESLICNGRARGFLSGAWLSRRGVFSLEEFIRLGEEALQIRDQLNPRNSDQAFINYCCDHKPIRIAHIADVFSDVCRSGWARQPGEIYEDNAGVFRLWDHGGLDHKKKVLLVHWAGIRLSSAMEQRRLFRKFLLSDQPLPQQCLAWLRDALSSTPAFLKAWFRRNRTVNELWHSCRLQRK